MKKLNLIAISAAFAALSTSALAQPQLPQLAAPIELTNSAEVSVNGQRYNKVISGHQLAEKIKLFAGDKVAKGAFNSVSKATGVVFVTLAEGSDAKQIASDLGLKLLFSNETSAVLKAGDSVDLLSLSNTLNSDSRVVKAKLELARNKHLPE